MKEIFFLRIYKEFKKNKLEEGARGGMKAGGDVVG